MKNRCLYPSQKGYKYYGGRGITICEEWLHDFSVFQAWSLSNGYKYNLTLDRIDTDGNYEPSNCRWVTIEDQAANKRQTIKITLYNVTKALKQWCVFFGVNYSTVRNKYIRNNLSPQEALLFYINKKSIDIKKSLEENQIILKQ